jgi:hypothetical protein
MSKITLSFPVTVKNEETGEESTHPLVFNTSFPTDVIPKHEDIATTFGAKLGDALFFVGLMLPAAPPPVVDGPTGPAPSENAEGANGPAA